MVTLANRLKQTLHGEVFVNEPMARRTSVRIGGPADILVEVASVDDIVVVQRLAKEAGIPLRYVGNGSNLLVADAGVRGIVCILGRRFSGIEFSGVYANCQAGASLPRLSKMAAARGLSGLEFGAGIPGTVGGAIVMNAGAHGGETAAIIEEVYAVDGAGNRQVFRLDDMDYAYRHSRFSHQRDAVVVGGLFRFTEDDPDVIAQRMAEFAQQRKITQPKGLASSGSVFKNPPGDYAGRLIDSLGLKGTRAGQAMISEAHGNFIVNCGDATAADVMQLIELAREQVQKQYGVELHLEVELIGM